MKYALRKLDKGKYSVIDLIKNRVIGTFRDDVKIRFEKNKLKEYVTLYNYKGKQIKILYVLPLNDIVRVEKIENNIVDSTTLSDDVNKFVTISNFYKEAHTINESNRRLLTTKRNTPKNVDTFSIKNDENDRVYIPGVVKIDDNKLDIDNVNIESDMVLIKTIDSVKSLTFNDLLNVLISADAKTRTIWDMGDTIDIDESTYGTNPVWQ